jgi:hypothetical protein
MGHRHIEDACRAGDDRVLRVSSERCECEADLLTTAVMDEGVSKAAMVELLGISSNRDLLVGLG